MEPRDKEKRYVKDLELLRTCFFSLEGTKPLEGASPLTVDAMLTPGPLKRA